MSRDKYTEPHGSGSGVTPLSTGSIPGHGFPPSGEDRKTRVVFITDLLARREPIETIPATFPAPDERVREFSLPSVSHVTLVGRFHQQGSPKALSCKEVSRFAIKGIPDAGRGLQHPALTTTHYYVKHTNQKRQAGQSSTPGHLWAGRYRQKHDGVTCPKTTLPRYGDGNRATGR